MARHRVLNPVLLLEPIFSADLIVGCEDFRFSPLKQRIPPIGKAKKMSKFNTLTATPPVSRRTTTNLAGGDAFEMSSKAELASILLTSFVQDGYYRSADDTLTRLFELLDEVPARFAAQAAVYARNEFGMRSISHVVAAELAYRVRGEQWTKHFISAVVRRPDDITEILAYYFSKYGNKAPKALLRGLGMAFDKFDAYQLAKYRAEGKAVSLVDAVNLTHPHPTAKNAEALKLLVNDSLRNSNTWETKLSKAGGDENAKEKAWRELLSERKIGYFALLRNLRNISQQAPDLIPAAAEMLVDPKLIHKSLVLPFRYLTALQEVSEPTLISALSKALDVSLDNVPNFDNSLIAIDHSGSMDSPATGNTLSRHYIGDIFAAALFKKNHSDVMVFGDSAGYVVGLNPDDSTLTIAEQIGSVNYGHGTNFQAIFELPSKSYNRFVIFSDMQAWVNGGWGYSHPGEARADYEKRTGAQPNVFSFDLAGHGSLQFPANKTFQIAGFSEKALPLMEKLETDPQAMVHAIEAVKF